MNTQTHLLIAAALLARPAATRAGRRANAAVVAGALAPDVAVTLLFVWGQVAAVPPAQLWGPIYFGEPMQAVQAVSNAVPLYAGVLLLGLALGARRTGGTVPAGFGSRSAHRATTDTMTPRAQAAASVRERGRGGMAERRLAAASPSNPAASSLATTADGGSGSVDVRHGAVWWGGVASLPPLALFAIAALVHLAGDLPLHADDAHVHFWPLTDWRFHSPISYWDPAHNGTTASAIEAVLGLALCVVLWRRFRARWVRGLLVVAAVVYAAVPLYWAIRMGG